MRFKKLIYPNIKTLFKQEYQIAVLLPWSHFAFCGQSDGDETRYLLILTYFFNFKEFCNTAPSIIQYNTSNIHSFLLMQLIIPQFRNFYLWKNSSFEYNSIRFVPSLNGPSAWCILHDVYCIFSELQYVCEQFYH